MTDTETFAACIATPDLRGARVGYVPYSSDLRSPGDRRRFCFYMKRRGWPFEIARVGERYDLIIVTPGGDLTHWSRYDGTARVVYEQIDGYLTEMPGNPRARLRGIAKFLSRQHSHPILDYAGLLHSMCRRANVVICASSEQRSQLASLNQSIFVVADCHDATLRQVKSNFAAGETFHLAWEGLPYTLHFLRELRPVFRELSRTRSVALHVVTDLRYGKYLNGKCGRRDAIRETSGLGLPVYLYSWQEQTCASILTSADLAIIPVPLNNPLATAKPENKLILLWRLGLPVIATATPSYSRVMAEAGLPHACRDHADWSTALRELIENAAARESAARLGCGFAERHYSTDALLARWDAAIAAAIAA